MAKALSSGSGGVAQSGGAVRLQEQVVCPHCWHRFLPEEVLWVSEHVDLLGDPVVGPEQQQRFLPSRFTPGGDAIDARSMACQHLACPRCHLVIPRGSLELEPVFLSVLGAPGSGKSFFLTAAMWTMRSALPHEFGLAFADADPAANRTINEYEESLFLNAESDRPIPLGDLIRKTELQGELYDTVAFGPQTVSFTRPYLFSIRPEPHHPGAGSTTSGHARMLCLYDNAGEHFLPGQDTTASPVTRHLAHSRALIFLFDPTQDPRFRDACRSLGTLRDGGGRERVARQELILAEAGARIRRHAGLSHGAKQDRPLIVVLSKFDAWSGLLGVHDRTEPWRKGSGSPVGGLDLERIQLQSANLRRLLTKLCPETVGAAESLSGDVSYIAISSLGDSVAIDPATGVAAIRPKQLQPYWAAVPFLFALHRVAPGLIPKVTRKPRAEGATPRPDQTDPGTLANSLPKVGPR